MAIYILTFLPERRAVIFLFSGHFTARQFVIWSPLACRRHKVPYSCFLSWRRCNDWPLGLIGKPRWQMVSKSYGSKCFNFFVVVVVGFAVGPCCLLLLMVLHLSKQRSFLYSPCRIQRKKRTSSRFCKQSINTVDGRNPAPPGMYRIFSKIGETLRN